MNANKTFKTIHHNGKKFNLLTLPNTNYFEFEIINLYGSNIERVIEAKTGKNLYGISHFIEHLSFKSTKDFSSEKVMEIGKNEGTYNATTGSDRINYWFKTTMENIDIGIRFVCNVALNDLTRVGQKEFETERNVVYNEAKRAWDNHQHMFYRNAKTKLLGYHREDNNIGIPETIERFTLADAIAVKHLFLSHDQNIYNLTYDNTMMSQEEVIEKIERELHRFEVASTPEFTVSDAEYQNGLNFPETKELILESEAKQAMTYMVIDGVENTLVTDATINYLASLAPESSLKEIIREKNGLTYGIYFYTNLISYRPYISFACDVTVGNETKLLELFRESINLTADNFNREKYDRYTKAMKLKRTMANLNLSAHNVWFQYDYRASHELDVLRDILAYNLDEGYPYLRNEVRTYEHMNASIQKIRELVNANAFAKVTTH